ncbi:hypothetical protein AT6N2_C1318 [Agrobacterium tumefaciens]|nr:hypothetical protein AT6N2_C1318 [Agrobacterium tumefaciens]
MAQTRIVQHQAAFVRPADEIAINQLSQRLVGVHDRKAERIGDMLLRDGNGGLTRKQVCGLCLSIQEGDEIGGALNGGATPDAQQVVVEHAFFARRNPCEVKGKCRVIGEEIVEPRTLEDAERDRRQRFDGMLHLAHHRSLQTDEITRHDVIEDLPAPVFQGLVTEGPAFKDRIKMGAVGAFHQDDGAAFHGELPGLETGDEIQLRRGEIPEMRQVAQRTLLTGRGRNAVRSLWRHEYPS